MIEFQCQCGEQLRVRPELAGCGVKCAACQTVVTAPGEVARSPRGKGGNRLPWIIGGVAALVLLVGGLYLASYWQMRTEQQLRAARIRSRNNLKEIGMAFHNWASAN